MSPHAHTEDQLVEQPAIGLFAALGWKTVSAMEFVAPPTDRLFSYHRIAQPLFEEILGRSRQIQYRRRTRDLLLPRLLSGQLDVEALPA
jgi:hypothetical protein